MESEIRTQTDARSSDHVSIAIQRDDDNLMLSIKEQMDTVSASHCICRVQQNLSKDNEKCYFPQQVSIGPFHKVTDTEDKKWGYLNALLNRKPNVESRLENCVKALKKLEPKVRKFYGEKIHLDSDELAKMMLLDGCFIIELLLKYSIERLRRRDDPFFNTKEMFFRLRCDIILLENQIPFFVLQRLFDIVPIPNQCTKSLTELALSYFRKMIPRDLQTPEEKLSQDFRHLLDLIHHCYIPTYLEVESSGGQGNLNCATEIQESGVRFKKAIATKSLLDIKFVNGVLQIPPLKFHSYTEVLFRNLIALEHCYCDRVKYVASYAFLMGKLVQSKKDLRLLHKTGILTNGIERKQEILDLFKKIGVEVEDKYFYYKRICEQVNRYKKTSWMAMACCWKMKEMRMEPRKQLPHQKKASNAQIT